jgi:hypothetical protein
MFRPCPFVHNQVAYQRLLFLSVVMRCGMGVLYNKSSSWREFHESRPSDIYTLFKTVNVLHSYFPCFLTDYGIGGLHIMPYDCREIGAVGATLSLIEDVYEILPCFQIFNPI